MSIRQIARSCAVLVAFLALAACTASSPREMPSQTPAPTTGAAPLALVAIGDSIPFNRASDCPGCTGFVDRYASALAHATGRPVDTQNLSEHNNLTLPDLLAELPRFKDVLGTADAIIVAIAHNTIALNQDAACGTTWDPSTNQFADWSKMTPQCAADSAAQYKPQYDTLFSTVAGWRAGKPTILLTLNKYNEWIGWAPLSPEHQQATIPFHDDWNTMLCASAEANGFTCVDVYHEFNGADGTKAAGELLASDDTHPSDDGNKAIAQLLVGEGFGPLQ